MKLAGIRFGQCPRHAPSP